MTIHDTSLPWLSLLALGAAHGINPAMGWLFAVGRGLHERDRRAVWRALGPLALGHAVAIGMAVLVAITLGQVLPARWLQWIVAATLVGVGVDGLVRHRHVRLGGMRVGAGELTTWSFLMASAHGAGLMVLPLVIGTTASPSMAAAHHHEALGGSDHAVLLAAGLFGVESAGVIVALIHTLGYLVVTALLAVLVYEKLGLRILRRAWINLDLLWAGALAAAGLATVLL